LAIGLVSEDRLFGRLPCEPYDVRVDGVVTEKRVVVFG